MLRKCLGILCLALVLRAGVLVVEFGTLAADPDAYRALAANLRQHGVLGNGERPTAFRPPLYPLLLAPVLGAGDRGIAGLHFVLGAGTVILAGLLARAAGRGELAPAAMLLVAVDPILLRQSTVVMTETLAAFCAALVLVVATFAQRRGTIGALALGAALGLAVLARPTFLAWTGLEILALGAAAVLRPAAVRPPAAWVRAGACVVGLAIVLGPWVARNRAALGRPIVGTTHGGFTLLLANNPEFYAHLRTAPWGEVWDSARFNAEVTPRLRRATTQAELASDERAYRMAREHIEREPAMFAWSCLVRLGRFWSPLPHRVGSTESLSRRALRWAIAVFYAFEFAAALYGLWLLRGAWASEPWRSTLLLALALAATHAVYWSDLRMRAPLTVGIALLASVGWRGSRPGETARATSDGASI
ncbi:MAG: phospholipid carrier-dependent glycosyltransferase [Pirellulales bacterium]|nr:phospholipid carrier-dependent glycosyltransferase [Pirellulales bacterium]